MSVQNITVFESHYFNYYIVSAFAEFLNNVEQSCYERLTDDWWHIISLVYIPKLKKDNADLDSISNKLFKRIMSEFSNDLLTEAQSKKLLKSVGNAVKAYSERLNPICYCRDPDCDWGCGVQRCGECIDVCRCRFD